MTQKILKVGNSAAVTIPKKFLKSANIKIGDEIEVQTDNNLQLILIKTKNSAVNTNITPEFKNWLNEFIAENKSTLKRLAQL